MSPSSLTYWTPSSFARRSIGSSFSAVGELLVIGVAVERVAVERDLRVEGLDLAVGGDDQRVDLGERGVLLSQTSYSARSASATPPTTSASAPPSRAICSRLLAREALERVDVAADELLGRLLGDLFDVDAALDAEHHQRLLGGAVEQDRRVVLGRDVGGVLDPERTDRVAVDVHAEDVPGVLAGLRLVGGELDAAGLAAAADQYLRLDDDRVADPVGDADGVLDGVDGVAGGDPQSVAGEQLLALIFEQVHCGAGL